MNDIRDLLRDYISLDFQKYRILTSQLTDYLYNERIYKALSSFPLELFNKNLKDENTTLLFLRDIITILSYIRLRPNISCLIIGCGSGYLTSIISYLFGKGGGYCLGIDIDEKIIEKCRNNIKNAERITGILLDNIELKNIDCFNIDSSMDIKFDYIFVNANCPQSHLYILYNSLKYLKSNKGMIIIPVKNQLYYCSKRKPGTFVHGDYIMNINLSDLIIPEEINTNNNHQNLYVSTDDYYYANNTNNNHQNRFVCIILY